VSSSDRRDCRLVFAYRRYLVTADAPRFAWEVAKTYCPSSLERLLLSSSVEGRRAAAIALGMVGDRLSIEILGRALVDRDRGVRLAADDSFRALLVRSAPPTHQHKLLQVMHLNDGGEFAAALAPALILTDQCGNFAEAYHQLAVCWMGLGDVLAAEHAYRHCLWICRFHYLAWVGLAHCRLRGEDPTNHDLRTGLRALRRALAICPDLEGVRSETRRLERAIENGLLGRRTRSVEENSFFGDDDGEAGEGDWNPRCGGDPFPGEDGPQDDFV